MTIGVLALQGDFDAHRRLEELGATVILVRKAEDFDHIGGLVIPGRRVHHEMITLTQRIKSHLLLGILLAIVCFTNMGCEFLAESTFKLADESRLPKWVTLPPGLTRADVSLTISYYSMPWGGSARFILQGKNGQVMIKEDGKVRCKNPFQLKHPPQGFPSGYPNYEAVTVNGITEIIEQKKPEAILYVTDDTAVWKQYQSIGCG